MKILLDECVDRRLARHITGHDVKTVTQMGWAGVKNGELLARTAREFDAFVTTDRNLSFQQNLTNLTIPVIVLRAKTNRIVDLIALVPDLLAALPTARVGDVTSVEAP